MPTSGVACHSAHCLIASAIVLGQRIAVLDAFLEIQRLDLEPAFGAMRLRVEPPDQPAATQDRQHVVTPDALGRRHVDLDPIVEVEHRGHAFAVPDDGIERRQQRRVRRAQASARSGEAFVVMLGMHVACVLPAVDGDAQQLAALDVAVEIDVLEPPAAAEVIVDPARLRDAERAHRAEHEFAMHRFGRRRLDVGRAHLREHALAQVVDALEIVAPRDHELAEREQRFEPALLVLPAPPAARAFLGALEIGRLEPARRANARENRVHLGLVLTQIAVRALHRPVAEPFERVAAMQRVVRRRRETGFVRPAFEDRAGVEQFVEPRRTVRADPRKQHEVRAARDDADRVDLQLAHALDRGEHVALARAPARAREQALRGEVQQARLMRAEMKPGFHVRMRTLTCAARGSRRDDPARRRCVRGADTSGRRDSRCGTSDRFRRS